LWRAYPAGSRRAAPATPRGAVGAGLGDCSLAGRARAAATVPRARPAARRRALSWEWPRGRRRGTPRRTRRLYSGGCPTHACIQLPFYALTIAARLEARAQAPASSAYPLSYTPSLAQARRAQLVRLELPAPRHNRETPAPRAASCYSSKARRTTWSFRRPLPRPRTSWATGAWPYSSPMTRVRWRRVVKFGEPVSAADDL